MFFDYIEVKVLAVLLEQLKDVVDGPIGCYLFGQMILLYGCTKHPISLYMLYTYLNYSFLFHKNINSILLMTISKELPLLILITFPHPHSFFHM